MKRSIVLLMFISVFCYLVAQNVTTASVSKTSNANEVNLNDESLRTFTVTIGDGSQTARIPIDLYFRNSLFETIYYSSEFSHFGTITGIKFYNSFHTNLPNKPIKIWLGTTTQTNLSAGWIPASNLTMVYNGNISFPIGQNIISIPLSTNFTYSENNLVMMVQKPWESTSYTPEEYFYCQTIGSNRTRMIGSSIYGYDPMTLSASDGNLNGQFPKTTFTFSDGILTNDMAVISTTGSSSPFLGKPNIYTIRVQNWGTSTVSSYTVKLMAGSIELGSAIGSILSPESYQDLQIPWIPSFEGPYTLSGKVIFPSDQNNQNDVSDGLNVVVQTFDESGISLPYFYNSRVVWGDYDNDGDSDYLLVGGSGADYISKVYCNNGNGNFTDVNAGLQGVQAGSVAWGDFDNDGDLDVLLSGRSGSSTNITKIYRNDGNNIFIDINANLIGVSASSLAWGDYDNDGDLDILLTGSYGTIDNPICTSKIYRNNGNSTFTDIVAGLTNVFGGSSSWGDYDNDGALDILLTGSIDIYNDVAKVYHNNGNGTFTDTNAGLMGPYRGSAAWGDYDNDGDLDILLISWGSAIYRNDSGVFTNTGTALHEGYDGSGAWGDYDNDGDLDILLTGQYNEASSTQIYRNEGNGIFTTTNSGLTGIKYGTATWIDYNNDGNLDIFLTGYNGSNMAESPPGYNVSKIYRNGGNQNKWLKIRTRGAISNTFGLGARIRCGTTNSQYREIASGNGWVNGLAHFGIGNLNTIDQLSVYWPKSNLTNTISQVASNQTLTIYEGTITQIFFSPNGGEKLPGASGQNNTYPITWRIENMPPSLHHVTLYYSTDGGVTYPNLIADNEPNDSIYIWTVPNVTSSTVRIKLQLKNSSGTVLAEKTSNGNVTIDTVPPTATINLIAPLNGAWASATPYFDWDSTGLVDVTSFAVIVDGNYLARDIPAANTYYQALQSQTLSSGWHTWTVRGFDIAGNWVQAGQTWSLRVEATPPSAFSLISPADSVWTNDNTPTFEWGQSMDNDSGLLKYQLFVNTAIYNVFFAFTDYTVPSLIDGSYNWYVNAIDNVSNIQQSSTTRLLKIDATAPNSFNLVSPANNAWTGDSLNIFTWRKTTDAGIGQIHYELWIDGANVSGSVTDSLYQLLPTQVLQSGVHTWYVKAVDGLGNSRSSSTYNIKIDRIPPADFTLLTPANGAYSVMPTPNFSWNATTDAGCGFSHYELWINGVLNVDNLTTTTSSPATSLLEGSYSWYVMAVDNVGNKKRSTAIWTTVCDWSPPTQPVLTSPINNQVVSMSRPLLTWQKSTDPGSGVHHYAVYIDNANTPAIASYIPADLNAQVVTVQAPDALTNGNHNWFVRTYDRAGGNNSSTIATFNIDVDITPPNSSSITSPVANQYIGGESYTITGSASDNAGGTGVQKVEISFDDGNTWFNTTHLTRTSTRNISNKEIVSTQAEQNTRQNRDIYNWQYIWTGYQTGSYTIKTRASDFNNNVQSSLTSVNVNVEKIAPYITNLNFPQYAAAGTLTITITFQTGPNSGGLNYSVPPTVTITPVFGIERPLTQTNYQGNTWTGQTTIAQTDLNFWVPIKVSGVRDNINNLMLNDEDQMFRIDTHPPFAFDLVSPPNNTVLGLAMPQLTWRAAVDTTSGIGHYELEVDGIITNNNIPATQNTIQSSALTTGTHSWRIKAVDRAGNFTWSSSSFNFSLDLTSPTSAISSPNNNSTIGGSSYNITGTATDGTGATSTGVAGVQIKITRNSTVVLDWTPVVNTGTNFSTWSYAWAGYISGTYILQTKATDSAGNIETSPLSTTVYVDLTPPVVQTAIITPNPAKVGTVNCNVLFTVNSSGLNFSVHPAVWFTTANADSVNFVQTSYSSNQWVGTATIAGNAQNGTATVHVKGAKDNINNTMSTNHNAGSFVIDTVAPTVSSVTVTPQITNVRTDLNVQVNFAADTAGLNGNIYPIVKIAPSAGGVNDYITVTQTGYNVDTRVWTGVATITLQSLEGTAAIKVTQATDLAGNVMQEATLPNQLTIDHSAPTAFNILQPVNDTWTTNRQPQISWSPSSDAISGLLGYKVYINGALDGGILSPGTTSTTVQTSLVDGGYQLRVNAVDNAQDSNLTPSGSSTTLLHVDGTAPTSLITSPANGFIVQGNSVIISGNAQDGIGASAGIGLKYVFLSKNGGANWDTVYVATSPTLGSVNWNHEYINLFPGNHTIAVKAADWLGNMELSTSSISVTVQAIPPVASFTANPTTGFSPLSVSFTDTSTQGSWLIASWEWNFGDGTAVSTQQNPTHEYTQRGTYSVSLSVRDMYNTSHTTTIPNMITVTNQSPYVLLPISDLNLTEDFIPVTIDLNTYFADNDDTNLTYSVASEPIGIVTALIVNNILTINSILNVSGTTNLTVTADDSYQPLAMARSTHAKHRATCSDAFTITVTPVNDSPVINSFLPTQITLNLQAGDTQEFSVTASDVDSQIHYEWTVNEVDAQESSSNFSYQFTQSGTYIVKVEVSDDSTTVEQNWTVNIPVGTEDSQIVPLVTTLYPCYPNPFNPETTIRYSLKHTGMVNITIFNLKGQLIKVLKNDNQKAGIYSLNWNGTDKNNNILNSGIYFIRMTSDKEVITQKSILLK